MGFGHRSLSSHKPRTSGHMMCYQIRTSSKAIDRGRIATCRMSVIAEIDGAVFTLSDGASHFRFPPSVGSREREA